MHRSDERKAILEVLANADGPLSPREIAKLIGRSDGAARQTLGRMAKDGEIAKAGRGRYTIVTASSGGCHNGQDATHAPDGSPHTGCYNGHKVTTGENS